MSKIYFTLTGTMYYHGNEFLKPGMVVRVITADHHQHPWMQMDS